MMHMPMILDLQVITARLAWALLLGACVGFERQWHQKMAGLKTNALVAVGAAGFVCFAANVTGGNPSQVAGQIVSGIGFLGAGVIMREGVNVHGLNTAATLWCSAMVGAFCGSGMGQVGGVAATLVLGTNIVLSPVSNWLNARVQAGNEVQSHYVITLVCDDAAAPSVRASLLKSLVQRRLHAGQLASGDGLVQGQTSLQVHVDSMHVADDQIELVVAEIGQFDSVRGVSWTVTRPVPES